MNENYIVTKSNYFIMNSSYDLSLEEQKLILTLASMVQPTDEEFKPYKFKIKEFMKLLGVKDKSKYTEIPKITKELMKKVFEIHEGNMILQVAWLSSARYEKGSGMVTLKFSPDLKPYMLQLKEKFTQYQLANVLSMKSKYSPRLYEILKCNEFKKQGYIEIEIKELRKLLKAENVYPKYNDFKRYVIERAKKELKKITDISFEFEELKTGRKVTSIKFYIKRNKEFNKIITNDEISQNSNSISGSDSKLTEEVKNIFIKHDITYKEANCILKDANNNIELIYECYNSCKNKNVENIIGYMRSLIKDFKPIKNTKKDSFNSYKQRKYNYNELEQVLLGYKDIDNTNLYE